jgi:apolipoprotein D and lipocalin family protein
MRTITLLFILVISSVFFSCSKKQYEPLETVSSVDLNKYSGKWYEIASFPQSFQKGCNCTTAEYVLTDRDYIHVTNRCNKDSVNGELDEANGKAFVVGGTNNSKLEVQFFWPFRGDYWIIELADDYSYAVVGHPNREYLWILSRTKTMKEDIYQNLLSKVKSKGFDITKLKKTNQDC